MYTCTHVCVYVCMYVYVFDVYGVLIPVDKERRLPLGIYLSPRGLRISSYFMTFRI